MLILRLLGPIDARLGGRPLAAASRDKGLTLLSYLAATAGHSHARENLADLFWPDFRRERALHNLRQCLLRLRGLLAVPGIEPPCLLSDKEAVAFDPRADYWLDLKAFSALVEESATTVSLERRAALYRGDFMGDLACDIGERFGQWLAERRAECRVTALSLESTLVTRHERAGRLERAIGHARRCIALEPWDETGQRRLLRLLALAGHAEAALSHFNAWREAVREEFGVAVAPETLALAEGIRCGTIAAATAVGQPQPSERRQLTVLDCGVPYDESEDSDDPEAANQPRRLAGAILEAHGGWIAEQRPGRIIAFFGWPATEGEATVQAARAACAVVAGMVGAHPKVDLAIGIHSGTMLVRTDEHSGWQVADGALRLRLTAPAGMTAVVSEAAAQALGDRFVLCRLSAAAGHPAAWKLGAEREPPTPGGTEACPLVGRATELARMAAAWNGVRAGGLRVLVLRGEAGIGKSRLVREFLRVHGEGAVTRSCECGPRDGDSPLAPLKRLLRLALDVPAGASAAALGIRLGKLLPDAGRRSETVRWLAPLIGAADAADGAPPLDPDQRARVMETLSELLVRLLEPSARGAVLVVDDLHWADVTTLDVLDALARHARERILLLLTARALPALPPGLARHAEVLELPPLDAAAAAALAALTGAGDDGVAAVLRAADGIPLFVVELARMQAAAGETGAIPARLQDLLVARLDQAGPDKSLLQAAAVIGPAFKTACLRGLMSEADGPVDQALARLAALKLLEREAGGARFSHVLLQRAAYASLPRARRAVLHRRYADQIQADIGRSAPDAPELLAWHLAAGELPGEAAQWWLRAARRASQLPAYAETARLAERALAALDQAPDRPSLGDTKLAALLLGAYARVALGGYFDPDAQALYGRARELLRGRPADVHQTFGVLRGYWLGASSRASHREARLIAEEMVRIADTAGLDALRGIARYLVGNSALWLGAFGDAYAQLEAAMAILQRARPDAGVLLAHDQDFEATATGYFGWACWYLGDAGRALELGRRALGLARARGHLLTLLHTATSFCSIGMGSGAAREVLAVSAEMTRLAREHGLSMWADIGQLQECWARTELGLAAQTEAAEQALERLCVVYPGGAPGFQVIAGRIHLARGEVVRAGAVIAALQRSLQSSEAGLFATDLHLLEGELARREGHLRRAARAFARGAGVAQAQGSPQLHAQALAALCALCPHRPGCAEPARCGRLRRRGLVWASGS